MRNSEILEAHRNRNVDKLHTLKKEILKDIKEYDVFFEEYLEVFSDKMVDEESTKNPLWIAYNDKRKEYSVFNQDLNLVNYYLQMMEK